MDIAERARCCGVVGAGGAGFPTHVKFAAREGLEAYIVNAAECEPLLQTDQWLMRNRAEALVRGAAEIGAQLRAKRTVIALKAKYRREIACLEAEIAAQRAPVTLHKMATYYPAGDEQLIVQEILGASVPERGIPLAVGAVVNNVATVVHMAEAMEGAPVTHQWVTVNGEVPEAVVLRVPIGTRIAECVAAARGRSDASLWLGGPMMGHRLDGEGWITKTDGGLLVLPRDHALLRPAQSLQVLRNRTRSACIQCRMCTDLCPRYLIGHDMQPHRVMRNLYAMEGMDDARFLAAFGTAANCSECGLCEVYSCPMLLSPRRVNQTMKGELRRRGLQAPANAHPQARPERAYRNVATARVIARLGLSRYADAHAETLLELEPESVRIPLKMHIGAASVPVVETGETVACGQLIAEIPEGALGARIHASLSGRVTVEADAIRIERRAGV